jgi:hypothetical protein
MVVYKRDPEKVQLHIPQPLELFPPQQRGLEFIVPAHARRGWCGTVLPQERHLRSSFFLNLAGKALSCQQFLRTIHNVDCLSPGP